MTRVCIGMPSIFSLLSRRRRSRKKVAAAKIDASAHGDVASLSPPSSPSDTANTAKNAFVLSLKTLGSVSENIPFAAVLNSVIEPLLDILSRVEQASENYRGFIQLASRIELLTPIVAQKNAQEGTQLARALERQMQVFLRIAMLTSNRELRSMHDDIKQALAHGKLAQFFNSDANSSGIAKHNVNLTQLIGDSTHESVNEILKTVRAMEVKKQSELNLIPIEERPTLEGGRGGSGGKGNLGGMGGLGEGPILNVSDAINFKAIRGGTGGMGGDGVSRGGSGGVGEASRLTHRILTLAGRDSTVTLQRLSIEDLCSQYCLSPAIQKIFEAEDYMTASALLEVSEQELQDMKFKRGQIAEIKRALREYLASQNIATVA
ncbi:hypothetical protein HMN09_01262700 [Mycena chlorophos]|uniref:Uncharacterized protein n=1 Tax=Mycena chlorophos TaxID=658473 RepID=A0A8H6S2U3_MYCCL|nr:hypothetical protein HMN09_01262700 [Mycena chlorophos]